MVRLFWKIAIPIACAAVIGGATGLWWIVSTKTDQNKLVEEIRTCRLRAEQGDAKAQAELGYRYSHGQGVPQDYAESFNWRRKAADQGQAKGEDGLAFMYLEGQGMPQDYAEALRWYRKAADQGDAGAEDSIALMYSQGRGVPQDYGEAFRWYRKSVDQGHAKAQYNLGNMYYYGRGLAKDRAEAFRWYRKAADQGDVYALRFLSEELTASRKFFLWAKLIFGLWLSLSFLSLNSFEPNKSLRDLRQTVKSGTGFLCIFSAGMGWYGYSHYQIRCVNCGFNAFTWFYWLLSGALLALLFYIILSARKPGEEQDGRTSDETLESSGAQTAP